MTSSAATAAVPLAATPAANDTIKITDYATYFTGGLTYTADFTAVVLTLSHLGGGVATAFVVFLFGLVAVIAGLVAEIHADGSSERAVIYKADLSGLAWKTGTSPVMTEWVAQWGVPKTLPR